MNAHRCTERLKMKYKFTGKCTTFIQLRAQKLTYSTNTQLDLLTQSIVTLKMSSFT